MVNHCVVWGCNFKYSKRKESPETENISLHAFPNEAKKKELHDAWTRAVRRENWKPNKYSAVCSLHFKPQDMDLTGQTRRLRDGAVPSVFPKFPVYLQKTASTSRKAPKERHNYYITGDALLADETPESEVFERDSVQSRESDAIEEECIVNMPQNSPLKRALQEKLSKVTEDLCSARKKIKSLKQTVRRQNKRLFCKKELIASLTEQNLISKSAAAVLENTLSSDICSLINRAVKNKSKNDTCQYSPELRSFALTLNYYSPKAYEFVRNKFNKALPCARTIRAWLMKVNCEPGFCKECFTAIELKARDGRSKGTEPTVCLSIDDMHLKEHVEFDGEKVIGYVDMGTEIEDDSLPSAKEACVIMCTSINDSWKIPCCYFFIDSMSGEERANVVISAVEKLYEIGVHVISLTFDGAPSNISMANALGANLCNPFNLQVFFPHPCIENGKIYVILDACHMIKLIRNCLADKKIIYINGKCIKWLHIESLFSLQKSEGLKLANKLSTVHMNWGKNKLKVRPAVQVLSKSVADALEYCNLVLNLEEFKDCEETVKFIRYFDRIFDLLNSCSLFGKSFKAPLKSLNENIWDPFITEAISYIDQLSICRDTLHSILFSNRKVGFLGFKVCLLSVRGMFNDLVASNRIKYLLTYKLSQDHLELFFGLIRQRGGWNNNPTCRQFKSAFKRLVIRNELKNINSGNCAAQSEVNILQVTSTAAFRSRQFIEPADGSMISTASLSNVEDVPVVRSVTLSLYVENVVEYIAGYVVKSVTKTLRCEQCERALISSDKFCPFITFKDEGGLIYPSADVVKVCRLTEGYYRASVFKNLNCVLKQNIPLTVAKAGIELGIFDSLRDHAQDLDPLDTHVKNLIQILSSTYQKIRIIHSSQGINKQKTNFRSTYNRLAIFKHL